MTDSNFREVCTALCHAVAAPVPNLNPDATGNTAIAMTLDDIEIVVRHEPERAPADALLTIVFGPLPRDNTLAACRALMDVNSLMLWQRACSFGRNRATGEIVLEYAYPLEHACGGQLYACIRELADVALDWRKHRFLDPSGRSPVGELVAACESA